MTDLAHTPVRGRVPIAAVHAIAAQRRRPRVRRFPLPMLSLMVLLTLVVLALAAARNAPLS